MKNNNLTNNDIGTLTYAKALVDSVMIKYVSDESMSKEYKRLVTIVDKLSQIISKD